ncbi:MAG: Capsule synthesis protein cap [Gemmatimonadetes bacterium]|nr:Capsule synthesis protein cap [Gemmatimonadota bacterium]
MRSAVRTAVLLAAALLASAPAASAQRDNATLRRPRADTLVPDTLPLRRAGVRVCAGGDVTLGTNLDTGWVWTASARAGYRVAAYPDPDSLLRPLRPLFADADVVLLNVEGAIGTGPAARKCAEGSTHCFAFRQPVATAAALRRVAPESAAVIGSVANNHARDAGPAGVGVTVRHLRAAGVRPTGADTLATEVVTAAGDTVAFLGFSQWAGPDPRDLAAVRRHVARAARRWPRVVVMMHMGAEGGGAQHTYDATEHFLGENRGNVVAFAHAAVESGAGLVIGAGPHVMRAAEQYRGGLIFYSLGNLLTYGPFSLREPLNRGAVACASLDSAGRPTDAVLRSTRQRPPGIAAPDPGARAAAAVDALSRADFPRTGVPVADDGTLLLAPADTLYAARRPARRRPSIRAPGPAGSPAVSRQRP